MKRVASALVGIPAVAAAVYLPGPGALRWILVVFLAIALSEYLALCGTARPVFLGAMAGGLFALWVQTSARADLYGLAFIPLFAAALWRVEDPGRRFRMLGEASLGMIYLSYAFTCLFLLRSLPSGPSLLMLTLLALWCGDSAAYYGGRRYGRRRLAPVLSPNKTWEGAILGLVGSAAGGGVFALLLGGSLPAGKAAAAAFVIGGVGQVGDIVQSLWKRGKGVKDSGRLIPGHGGLLDRIDSLLLGAPAAWLIFRSWAQ